MPLTDPVLVFTILISVILLAPLIAARVGVPDLVLLLLAGTLLGPHGTGLLERSSAITLFGSVGLLYIMFLAGLEIDLHRFNRTRNKSIAFGLLTFSIPQAIGTLVGRYVLSLDWPASILLASMFASHTLLAYPIASRLNINKSESVSVTVGATIITDTLALLVLAVIADMAKGVAIGLFFWAGIGLGVATLIVLAWWGIPILSRWFFKHVSEDGGAQFLFVLAVVCTCSYLSHYAKMEPIIGAFLAGAAFNRLIPEHSALMSRVHFVGNSFFIPFFLISVGMLVDPGGLIRDPKSWVVTGAMVFTVIFTKWMAASLAAKSFSYTRDDAKVMFGLSVVQAAATLAAVLVGYDLKIFDVSVINGTIGMILVTVPLGSWMVGRYGRRMAALKPTRIIPPGAEQRILVPVAGAPLAPRLMDLAYLLRDKELPGTIYPVTIVQEDEKIKGAVTEGERLLSLCLAHAAAAEMRVMPSVRIGLNVADGIVRASKELRADVVLMGWSSDRSVASRFLGVKLKTVLEECPCRVAVCRLLEPLNTSRRLLLVLPHLSQKKEDILSLLKDIKTLSLQTSAVMNVVVFDAAQEEALKGLVEKAKPSIPVRYMVFEQEREALEHLLAGVKKDDLIVVPMERRFSALWSPYLDRLLATLATSFPDNNLVAVYPALPEEELDGIDGPSGDLRFCNIFSADTELENVDAEDAITRLVGSTLALSPEHSASLIALLLDSSHAYPLEMAPGIALLHAHSDAVSETKLILGRVTRPLELPGCSAPTRLLLSLISPKDKPPELHIKALSSLARCFHEKAVLERIEVASTALETAAILRECLNCLTRDP